MSASTRIASSRSSRHSSKHGPLWSGGMYFARDEVGDCYLFTRELAALCAIRGVRFHYGATIKDLEVSGRSVYGVISDRGRMQAEIVVVAMGSLTGPLLRKVGIYEPIYPVKGISVTFDRGSWNSAPRTPVIDDSNLFGFVPIGERLRIAGSAEINGFDSTLDEARADAIVANASRTFPQITHHLDSAKARVWVGLRPVTPSGTPIIAETSIPGLWINSSHGHLGWTLACGSGRIVADLIGRRGRMRR